MVRPPRRDGGHQRAPAASACTGVDAAANWHSSRHRKLGPRIGWRTGTVCSTSLQCIGRRSLFAKEGILSIERALRQPWCSPIDVLEGTSVHRRHQCAPEAMQLSIGIVPATGSLVLALGVALAPSAARVCSASGAGHSL
jgi:hypothetical protein